MKNYKNILSIALIVALIVPVTFTLATPKAEAACSYQGYLSSNGKCSNSFKTSYYYNYNGDDDYRYQYRYNFFEDRYEARISYLEALIEHLQELLEMQKEMRDDFGDYPDINIRTLSARDVDGDSALLRGDIDFGDSDEAEVWFEYGTNFNNLSKNTPKVNLDDSDEGVFTKSVDDLDDDTIYYFRAVGEDENGVIDYGNRLSFRTSDIDSDDEPDVTTSSVRNVDENSAVLRGSVDMNDFSNGRVFFVYGEDEGQIEDAEGDFDTYSEVDEDGDNFQKVLVDNDLDGTSSYVKEVTGLNDDTRHYYRLCVEFEDEDSDDKLICGDVEEFETDEN